MEKFKKNFQMHSQVYTILIAMLIAGIVFIVGFGYFQRLINNYDNKTQQNLSEAKKIYEAIPVWHKKIQTNQEIKIGVITDTHVHASRINKSDKSIDAPRYLKQKERVVIDKFVNQMNNFKPNIIVHLGDVIEGTNESAQTGVNGLKLTQDILKQINVPIYWVVGNHDLRSVTKEQFENALNIDKIIYKFDVDDYRFIVLDANYNIENASRTPTDNAYIRGHLPPWQLDWLKEQLATDKQTFVFMHQGAFLDNSKGDYKEEKQKNKMKQSIDNAEDLQKIFNEYRVAGFFNGHMEARRYEKNKWTAYNSLTGTKKSADYPDSYYELIITNGVPNIAMYYRPIGTTQIKKVDFESGEK